MKIYDIVFSKSVLHRHANFQPTTCHTVLYWTNELLMFTKPYMPHPLPFPPPPNPPHNHTHCLCHIRANIFILHFYSTCSPTIS